MISALAREHNCQNIVQLNTLHIRNDSDTSIKIFKNLCNVPLKYLHLILQISKLEWNI